MDKQGLKNHQIAGLVTYLATALRNRWDLPQSTRDEVSRWTCDYLRENKLMLDSSVKRYNISYEAIPREDGGYDVGEKKEW